MIARAIKVVLGLAAFVVAVALAVVNRQPVTMVLDPLDPQHPMLALELQFYVYLIAMLAIGIVMGGIATWISQGKWRRMARMRAHDVQRWRGEAERLARERDARLLAGPAGSGVGRGTARPSDIDTLATVPSTTPSRAPAARTTAAKTSTAVSSAATATAAMAAKSLSGKSPIGKSSTGDGNADASAATRSDGGGDAGHKPAGARLSFARS